MIEDIHPSSKIGIARAQLETLRGRIRPLEEHLKAHKAERLQKQTLVERATLDTPPIEVATAESRIRLLDKAMAREAGELTPLLQQLQTAERHLAELEWNAEMALAALPDLQDVRNLDLSTVGVARWVEQLRDVRNQLQSLTEAPLVPAARYVPIVSVSFRLMQPGEELPARGPSFVERQRLLAIEQDRAAARAVAAGIERFTHEPVVGVGR